MRARGSRRPAAAILAGLAVLAAPALAPGAEAVRLDVGGVRTRFAALGETVVVPAKPEVFLLALARPYLEVTRTPSGRAEFDVEEPGEYEIWLPPDPPASGSIGRILGPEGGARASVVARLFAPAATTLERAPWELLHRGWLESGRHTISFENEEARSIIAMPVSLLAELLRGLGDRRVAVFSTFDAGRANFEAFQGAHYIPNVYGRVRRSPEEIRIPLMNALKEALGGPSAYRLAPAARGEVAFWAVQPDRSATVEPQERILGDVILLRQEPPIGIEFSDRLRLEWTVEGGADLRLLAVIDLNEDGAADLLACPEEDAVRILKDTFLLRRPFTFQETLRWERRRKGISEEITYGENGAIITFPPEVAIEDKEDLSLRLEVSHELADYPYVVLSCAVENPDRQKIAIELEVDADRNGRAERRLRAAVTPGEPGKLRETRVDFLKVLRDPEPFLGGGQVLGVRIVLERLGDPSGVAENVRRFELGTVGIARKDSVLPVARAFSLGRVIITGAAPASPDGPSVRDIPIGGISRSESPEPLRLHPRLLAILIVPDVGRAPSHIRIRALSLIRMGNDMLDLAAWPTRIPVGENARASERLAVGTGGLIFLDRFALTPAPAASGERASRLPPLPLLAKGLGGGDVIARWHVDGGAAVLVHGWEEGMAITSRQVRPQPASAAIRLPVSADLRAYPRLEGTLRYAWRGGPPIRLDLFVSLDPDPAAPPSDWVVEELSLEPFAGEPKSALPRRIEIPLLDRVEARYPFAPAYRIREVVFHAPEGDYDLHVSDLALHPAPKAAPIASRFTLADWSVRVESGRIITSGGARTWLAWLPPEELPAPARGVPVFSLARDIEPIDVAAAPLMFLAADLSPRAPAMLSARLRAARIRDGSGFEKILRDPANRWVDLRGILGEDVRLTGIDLLVEWLGTPILGTLPELSLRGFYLARDGSMPATEFLTEGWDLEPERAWEVRFLNEEILRSWEWTRTGGDTWQRFEGGELRIGARFDENVPDETYVRLRTKTPRIDLRRFPFLRLDGSVDDARARSVDLEFYLDGGAGRPGRSVRVALPPGLPVLDLDPVVASVFPDLRADEVPLLAGIAVYLTTERERAAGIERGGTRELRLRRIEVFGPARRRRSFWESLAEEPLWRIDQRVFRPAEIPGILDAIAEPEARAVPAPPIALDRGTHIFEPYAHPLVAARSLLLVPEGSAPPIPEIAWRRVNATRYVASVRAESPFLLVLNELYHGGWRAYIRGAPRGGGEGQIAILSGLRDASGAEWIPAEDHWVANGYGNGFFIRRTGDYEVVVEFFPQRYLEAGVLITGFVLLGVVALAASRAWRRSRSSRIRAAPAPPAIPAAPAAPATPAPAIASPSDARRPRKKVKRRRETAR